MSEQSRRMTAAARRLADQNTERTQGAETRAEIVFGTVVTVTAGAGRDGNPLVSVRIGTGVVQASAGYLPSYTPLVGQRVMCAHTVDDQLAIIGGPMIGYA